MVPVVQRIADCSETAHEERGEETTFTHEFEGAWDTSFDGSTRGSVGWSRF